MNNVLAKAQRMILDENFNRDVERAASIQRGSKGGSDDFSAMEDALFGVSSGPSLAGYEKVAIPEDVRYSNNTDYSGVQLLRETPEQPRNMANSKLPKAIVESFSKVPSPIEDAYSPATIETALQMAPKKAAPVREGAVSAAGRRGGLQLPQVHHQRMYQGKPEGQVERKFRRYPEGNQDRARQCI